MSLEYLGSGAVLGVVYTCRVDVLNDAAVRIRSASSGGVELRLVMSFPVLSQDFI